MSARHRKAGHGFGLIAVLFLASLPAMAQEPEKSGGPDASDNPSKRAVCFLRGRTVPGRSGAELLFRAHQQKLSSASRRCSACAKSPRAG